MKIGLNKKFFQNKTARNIYFFAFAIWVLAGILILSHTIDGNSNYYFLLILVALILVAAAFITSKETSIFKIKK